MSSAEPPATSVVKIPPSNCRNVQPIADRPDSLTRAQYLDVGQLIVLNPPPPILPVLGLSGSRVNLSVPPFNC